MRGRGQRPFGIFPKIIRFGRATNPSWIFFVLGILSWSTLCQSYKKYEKINPGGLFLRSSENERFSHTIYYCLSPKWPGPTMPGKYFWGVWGTLKKGLKVTSFANLGDLYIKPLSTEDDGYISQERIGLRWLENISFRITSYLEYVITFIRTKGALRRPLTYDDQLSTMSTMTTMIIGHPPLSLWHFLLYNAPKGTIWH